MFSLMYLFFMIFFINMFLMMMNIIFSKKENFDREKISSFECGFESMVSSRLPFSIQFFMIGILFLVFDVEIVFLFSLIDLKDDLNYFEWLYISLLIIMILYIGLEFEKMEGSLKWIF